MQDCGAEALVRYIDSDGKIVGPAQFIPQLEQAGNVRHVDLYIFEEVCRALKRWKAKGICVYPRIPEFFPYHPFGRGIDP